MAERSSDRNFGLILTNQVASYDLQIIFATGKRASGSSFGIILKVYYPGIQPQISEHF
jgi:hypothetical protein